MLMALRDAGWRIINLACSLGRPEDSGRRRVELERACAMAGFQLIVPDELPPIGAQDDLVAAQRRLSDLIVCTLRDVGAQSIVGPSPHDGHHGHEVVGRAIRDAVEQSADPLQVLFWGLWADLPLPNLLVSFDAARLSEITRDLGAHAGELARNPLDRLAEARATANAVLGPERVFGFGAPGIEEPYAELLTDVVWRDGRWRLAAPRTFDPDRFFAADHGPDVGWWLHSPSARSRLASPVPDAE